MPEKVQPHRARAMRVREVLVGQLETLKVLECELKRRPDQDIHERTRPDMVAVAIEHLEQAMAALLMASQE